MFVLSYEKPTPGLESVADTIVTRDRDRTGTKKSKESTETLLMNFDPDELPSFVGANQSGLTQF
jgi:hypothetical protein